MKRVYFAKHPADAQMVKDLLQQQGIPALVQGEALWGGRVPVTHETLPTVWVENDADYDRAREIVGEFDRAPVTSEEHATFWRCRRCGETVESSFEECWNCGAARAG